MSEAKAWCKRLITDKSGLIETLPDKPLSSDFGLDRGVPVDRFYIEHFLSSHAALIRGATLEVSENRYTKKFGGDRVSKALTLHVKNNADVIGNLVTGEGLSDIHVDCFIMTQTLPFIYESGKALKNAISLLNPGGFLLLTVPGITPISRFDMANWGQYWSFTDRSLRRLIEEIKDAKIVDLRTYGNVKTSMAFLLGAAQHELKPGDFEVFDPAYQLVIGAAVQRVASN